MEAYQATFTKKDSGQDKTVTVMVVGQSLRNAAVKADAEANANGKGDLTSLILLPDVVV